MTYTLNTDSYNERRYGRPWIAEVSGKYFRWGHWVGRPGEAGELTIAAEPGALIATGQKDLRKGRGGVDAFYLAMPDGKLYGRYLDTQAIANQWAKRGWKAYAEHYAADPQAKNALRTRMARMAGIEDPIARTAAEAFGLVDTPKQEHAAPVISMEAFG